MARLKVVAHRKTGHLVKGYTELPWALDQVGNPAIVDFKAPTQLSIHPVTAARAVVVSLDSLKAIFFVKNFDGNPSYAETKFFNPEPQIEGLWVHVTFQDGEVTEGIVHNGLSLLNDSGFLMKPPDPQSNNQAVYVLKSAISAFRVVGVRAKF
ncbi:MAG TPA: hypothetical protein VN577_15485 [Terriglobales bacterium]|nr:hypothetical protein [Terriglobales bacterium]